MIQYFLVASYYSLSLSPLLKSKGCCCFFFWNSLLLVLSFPLGWILSPTPWHFIFLAPVSFSCYLENKIFAPQVLLLKLPRKLIAMSSSVILASFFCELWINSPCFWLGVSVFLHLFFRLFPFWDVLCYTKLAYTSLSYFLAVYTVLCYIYSLLYFFLFLISLLCLTQYLSRIILKLVTSYAFVNSAVTVLSNFEGIIGII